MEIKMYQNKCKTCGTITMSMAKTQTCEACGSDDIVFSKVGKPFDIKMLIAKILIGAIAVGGLLALILM